MNRRNVLIGLGTIVAGGGAALGTGAFSSVEATRTVSVGVADDANAFLALEKGSELHTNAVDNSGEQLKIDLSSEFGQPDGEGVNVGAVTTIGKIDDNDDVEVAALTVTNNGENTVTLTAEVEGDDTILELQAQVGTGDLTDLTNVSLTLAENEVAKTVIVIDTNGYDLQGDTSVADVIEEITFTAEAQESV